MNAIEYSCGPPVRRRGGGGPGAGAKSDRGGPRVGILGQGYDAVYWMGSPGEVSIVKNIQ